MAPLPGMKCNRPVQKTLASTANLANLLPTGTVLTFEALISSFSNDGTCQIANQYLTTSLIAFCALTCFLSSFTDSFTAGKDQDEKLYYGIAVYKGFYIFNRDEIDEEDRKKAEEEHQLKIIDFVHAFVSLLVFLTFALSNSDVERCLFRNTGPNGKALIMNLPLAAGVLASFLFMIFPTERRGIGYADMAPQATPSTASKVLDKSNTI